MVQDVVRRPRQQGDLDAVPGPPFGHQVPLLSDEFTAGTAHGVGDVRVPVASPGRVPLVESGPAVRADGVLPFAPGEGLGTVQVAPTAVPAEVLRVRNAVLGAEFQFGA